MTTLKQLQALIEAGDKATQGEYNFDTLDKTVYAGNEEIIICERLQFVKDGEFFTLASNSRPAIKAAIAELEAKDKEIERLRRLLERVNHLYKESELSIYKETYLAKDIKQALGACETTERSEDNDE